MKSRNTRIMYVNRYGVTIYVSNWCVVQLWHRIGMEFIYDLDEKRLT